MTRGNRRVHISRVSFILQNPFYCGHFRYAGELYEGNAHAAHFKSLYDKANIVLSGRGRPQNIAGVPSPFCGLLRCGNCGMGITAETKVRHQKNGNVHEYTYYRCTRKNKAVKCKEAPVRSELLNSQLSNLAGECAIPQEWISPLSSLLDTAAANAAETAQSMRNKRDDISRTIARLTHLYVAADIERDEYLSRKRELTSEKRTVEENIALLEHTPTAWVEPVQEWILGASRLGEIGKSEDLPSKKSSLQKVFGLNLSIHAREARGNSLPTRRFAPHVFSASAPASEKALGLMLVAISRIEPIRAPVSSERPASTDREAIALDMVDHAAKANPFYHLRPPGTVKAVSFDRAVLSALQSLHANFSNRALHHCHCRRSTGSELSGSIS